MILYAADDWREPPLLGGLFGRDHGSHYAMVEITLFVPLFFVNVLPKYEDEPDGSRWRRFLLPSFRSVMDLLQNLRGSVKDAEYEVSILVPGNRFPDNEPVLGTLVEVKVGKDREHGAQAVVYILADGRRLLDAHVASSEEELGELETIYRKKKCVSPSGHDKDPT